MTGFFKSLALVLALACMVWLGVLWHWESTQRDFDESDAVLYLGVLPVLVIAAALLLRWAWRAQQARAAAQAAAAGAPAASGTPAPAAPSVDEAQRQAWVHVLGTACVAAAGAAPAELLSAAKAGQPRPDLDGDLRDEEGLPVMCARMADLDVDALSAMLEPLLATPEGATAELPPPAVLRGLALVDGMLSGVLSALDPWLEHLDKLAAESQAARGQAGSRAAAAESPPVLRMLFGVPSTWSADHIDLAGRWLQAKLEDQIGARLPVARRLLSVQAVASGEDLWLKADKLLLTLGRDAPQDLLMLLACHSDIDEARIRQLEAAQQLFTSRQKKGRIPGEAAAAIVLGSQGLAAAALPDEPPARLHRAALLRRDKPVGAAGRVGSDIARQALEQAFAAAGLKADGIAALVSDSDQHSARTTEFFGALVEGLPHLDLAEDVAAIGATCGHVGIANTVLAAAMAAQRARDDKQPCAALTVGDDHLRLALVARLAPDEPADASANAGASPNQA